MTDRVKYQKKMLLKGIENLYDFGGFIREEIEDEIDELYSNEVIEKTQKYFPLGTGFCEVADAVEGAIEYVNKYAEEEYDEYGDTCIS